VIRVDVDTPAASVVAARYDVTATPTYLLVDGHGNELWRKVGGMPPRDVIVARLAAAGR